jgi:ubiquinone/menaquinone biosynthesis C-methylase UbiE
VELADLGGAAGVEFDSSTPSSLNSPLERDHMATDTAANVQAWNTVLFERWCRYKHLITVGMSPHGLAGLDRHPVPAGGHVLDVGCGFGDTTREIARRVGPSGRASGVDCAENFVVSSRREAAEEGITNADFFVADVQTDPLHGPYDAVFSRFGTMFFNFPGAALRNLCRSLEPGGKLVMVVWRKREENPFLHEAELVARSIVPVVEADQSAQPTCGPGPFSMAGPDMVSEMMQSAGFEHVTFERHDSPVCIGVDVDEAVRFALDVGPAGEIMRLAEADGVRLRPQVEAELRRRMQGWARQDGAVYGDSSTWIVSGRRPLTN